MQYYPYTQAIPKDMLEIVDTEDKPLLLKAYKDAKHLPHRFVVVILQDAAGKILLWRNKKKKTMPSSTMGLLYSHVHAGEARENTAMRLLEKTIPALMYEPRILEELSSMQGHTLRPVMGTQKGPFTRQNPMTVFILRLTPEEKSLLNKDLLWLDFDELQGFATYFSDMLTPSTLELIQGNYFQMLFTKLKP